MRMTLNDDVRITGFRRLALTAAAALLAGSLLTACGGGKDEEATVADTGKAKVDTTAPATPPANADEKHERLAAAVVDSKTTAPIDMQAAVGNKATFSTRRVIRNGQFNVVAGPAWAPRNTPR